MFKTLNTLWGFVTDPTNLELGIALIPLIIVVGILVDYALVP